MLSANLLAALLPSLLATFGGACLLAAFLAHLLAAFGGPFLFAGLLASFLANVLSALGGTLLRLRLLTSFLPNVAAIGLRALAIVGLALIARLLALGALVGSLAVGLRILAARSRCSGNTHGGRDGHRRGRCDQ